MEQKKKYFVEDWIGKRYGHLEIIGYDKSKFICKCDCGNIAMEKPSYLFYGKVSTCGLNCPIHKSKNTGKTYERLYRIWSGMKQRCYNKNHKKYYLYGERNITVCDEWKNNYDAFKEWALSNGYRENLTIDRIDGNKGYCPENCRWATFKEQRDNAKDPYTYMNKPQKTEKRFHGKLYKLDGQLKPKAEWCYIYGLSVPFVDYRLKNGMTFEEAIKTPKGTGRPKKSST